MVYKTHYLTQVIFQANFDNIQSLKTVISPKLIAVCEEKTDSKLKELKNRNISILPNQEIITQLNSRWLFKSENFQVVIQSDLIQIITFKYTNHQNFHNVIEVIFNEIKSIYNPIYTRIALRYINNINFPSGNTYDFSNLINESLLRPTLEYKDEGLSRSIGSMVIIDNKEELTTTNFTYGFYNQEFPNKIAKRAFILDFDCFRAFNDQIETISPILLSLRNKVNHLFEKSILSDLRNKML